MSSAGSLYLDGQHLPPYLHVHPSRLYSLTPREQMILRMLAVGLDNRSAARKLGISEATVKRHLTAVLAKLGVESRLKAGLIGLTACLAGWLEWHESVIDEGRIDRADIAAGN
jgi:DNA-binding NarL/FixJ family response regulator